jgi:hypothetical protein
MNVVLTIEGKEGIPVRALAYVTSWRANSDEIVKACAMPPTKEIGSYSIRNRQALPTYLVSESTCRSMLSVEWEPFIVELECMEKKLKADERTDGENWHHSREQAIPRLPAGAFVRLDDFQRWFSNSRPMKSSPTLSTDEDADDYVEQESDSLTLDPYIPAESQGDVFSGFDRFLQVPATETPVAELANKSNEFQEGCAADDDFAALFDPVSPEALAKMFPDDNWSKWAERAGRSGLLVARTGRRRFNPHRAAIWWLNKKAPVGWDLARVHRALANNLPARSLDSKYLFELE